MMEFLSNLAQAIILGSGAALVGYPLALYWQVRQKRRESALETSQKFYAAYGAFFATWKDWHFLWRRTNGTGEDHQKRQNELYERATRAEAEIEALVVKLACERALQAQEVEAVAKFRQAYQQLREMIRENQKLSWGRSQHPGYLAFKENAAAVGYLIATLDTVRRPDPGAASSCLIAITHNYWEFHWQEPLSRPPAVVRDKIERLGLALGFFHEAAPATVDQPALTRTTPEFGPDGPRNSTSTM